MRALPVIAIAVAVVGLGVAGWAVVTGLSGEGRIDPGDPRQVALGAEIYKAQCASCHGANLEGEADWRTQKPDGSFPAPPHDATGHTWHHPDSVLIAIVEKGSAIMAPPGFKSTMPAYGDTLSDKQIRAVLAYIKSRWPEQVRARQEEINRRAEG